MYVYMYVYIYVKPWLLPHHQENGGSQILRSGETYIFTGFIGAKSKWGHFMILRQMVARCTYSLENFLFNYSHL